jgi:hypothetical protein
MCALYQALSLFLVMLASISARLWLACLASYRGALSRELYRALMRALYRVPSLSLIAPASIFTRPRLACFASRRGALSYELY